MDSDGQIRQHESQSGRGLRSVAQAVAHDGGCNCKHQEEVQLAGVNYMRWGHVIDGIADEIEQRPASSGAGSGQDAVALVGFVAHSDGNHGSAKANTEKYLSGRSQVLQLIGEKERQAEHEDANADLVQPVGAEHLFEIEPAA